MWYTDIDAGKIFTHIKNCFRILKPLYKSVSDCLCGLPPTFILPRVSAASRWKQTLAYVCSVHSETPFLLSGPSSSHPCHLRVSWSLLHLCFVALAVTLVLLAWSIHTLITEDLYSERVNAGNTGDREMKLIGSNRISSELG